MATLVSKHTLCNKQLITGQV